MGFNSKVRQLVDPTHGMTHAQRVQRKNLSDVLNGMPLRDLATGEDAVREAGDLARRVDEELESGYGAFQPEQIAEDAVTGYAVPNASALANQRIFSHLKAEGRPTKYGKGTVTDLAPTVRVNGQVFSHKSPDGSNDVLASYITPMQGLAAMVGSKERARVLETRLGLRNLPFGEDGAHIYHGGDLKQDYRTPWIMFRDLKNSMLGDPGSHGFARPMTRQMFVRADKDPDLTSPKVMRATPLNVSQHELIHAILDPQIPSVDHFLHGKSRPAIAGVKAGNIPTISGRYLASDSSEMANLLFHTKRLTELVNPNMRDVGENEGTLKNWLDYVRAYKPGAVDPAIDMPGHMNHGLRAHGYEEQMRDLQEILKNADGDALRDIDDLNFRTGQRPDLRKALLS